MNVYSKQMNGYTKLFTDIVTSSIWQEPNDCRVLWITILALKDETNICRATIPALAKLCNITIEDCEKYLNKFMEPDKYSRSKEFDGKRIEPVEGGYLVLNGQKYRDMLRGAERRDYVRRKVQEHRERVNKCKQSNQCKPIAEAEAEAEAIINKGWNPTPIQIRLGKLFKRRDTTKWSDKEIKAFKAIGEIPEDELVLVEKYHASKAEYRRRDIQTLLNNWNAEVDRARFQVGAQSGTSSKPTLSDAEILKNAIG